MGDVEGVKCQRRRRRHSYTERTPYLSFWAGVIGGRNVVLIGMLHLVEKTGVEIDVLLSLSVPFLEVETTPCCRTDYIFIVAAVKKKKAAKQGNRWNSIQHSLYYPSRILYLVLP